MAETESDIPKMKRRPIVRLGLFLMSRSLLASVVCCSVGVLALLLLPVLAKNTYISENALMPGSANPMLSNQDIVLANKLAEELSDLDFKSADTAGIQSRRLIAQYISNLGAEASYHKFHPPTNRFNPLLFFATPDSGMIEGSTNCSIHGVNMVGIIRAPRGDGKEAIVLVTPYNFGRSSLGETLSLSIAFSVFSLLTRVTWLAKDIIWLVADSQFGEYPPVAAWLRDYHTPAFSSFGTLDAEMCRKTYSINELEQDSIEERDLTDGLKRAGTMAAALVIKVADKNEPFEDSLGMYVEASNGQMPNLDLINIVNYLAVHRQGFRVKVQNFWSLLGSKWLKILGEVFELLGDLAKSLNPQWKFGIPAADYIEGTATLASSLYYQALGIPTGSHGAFRDFQVDAITLEISPRVSSTNKGRRNEFLLRGGRLIEGVTKSVNNLLEKFHQSFFLYLLTSPSKFVSVGVYMIPFALLVAPLPLVAASLYADADSKNLSPQNGKSTSSTTVAADDEIGVTFRSWKWLNAARKVFVVHVWGAIVSLLPYFISRIPDCSPEYSFGIWVIFSMLVLLILYFILGFQLPLAQVSQCENGEWAILKSVTTSAVFIGLCLMSVINFATAEIGALLMVPTCLLAHPLKLDIKACNLKSVTRLITNLVLVNLSFPPAAFFVLKGVVEGLSGSNVGDFWIWVESLWAWNSATYLYMGMIHLPCWVLCLHVLLHSC